MSMLPALRILRCPPVTATLLLLSQMVLLSGCGAPDAEFHLNLVYAQKQKLSSPQVLSDTANVMAALFGTPDDPHVPVLESEAMGQVLDEVKLEMSAGRVASDESGRPQGLYREHCAHCHGITGDGRGPTAAFLNPYPRDYRPGIFKFKSTPIGSKPTDDDLKRILIEGIPGTAMPSFALLSDPELDSLVEYVKYLSIRGEVERLLMYEISTEEAERLLDMSLKQSDAATYEEQLERVRSTVDGVAARWARAPQEVTPVQAPPEDLDFFGKVELWDDHQRDEILALYRGTAAEDAADDAEEDAEQRIEQVARRLNLDPQAVRDVVTLDDSIRRGRDIYYGAVANCVKCHGDSALGDGQTTDFDDWTKEIEPQDPEALANYLELGALHPRTTYPRNLRLGVYRGGRRPIDIYWRIYNGIYGTPMPKTPVKADDAPPEQIGLTNRDLWDLINYVRSLPFEPVSKPAGLQPGYQRDRPL